MELLRERPTTLGEAFSLARLIEARFEAIAEIEKEQTIKKKAYNILSLQSELASLEVKGSLDVDEDIGVDEFREFSENKESVEEVVVSGGEALEVDEDEPNRVISVLKDGCDEFDDNIDEINLAKYGRRLLCYVQGSRRRKRKKSIGCNSGRRDCTLLGALVFPLFNPGPGSFAHKRILDPEIKIFFRQQLEGKTKPLDEDDDVVVLENSETKEEDVKEDESDHNKERYTFKDDDDDWESDDLD
nr:hypothetical protein [Tanacetum cinerariifolium]